MIHGDEQAGEDRDAQPLCQRCLLDTIHELLKQEQSTIVTIAIGNVADLMVGLGMFDEEETNQ